MCLPFAFRDSRLLRCLVTTSHVIAVMLTAAGAAQAEPALLHVHANGNDAWSGEHAEPTADAADGPLATLEGARDRIRAMRKDFGTLPADGVRVIVHSNLFLDAPLTLEPQDSGTEDAPISFEGARGTQPTLSGAYQVPADRWTQEGELWAAEVPELRDRGVFPVTFISSGERRVRARTPNAANTNGDYPPDTDFFTIEDKVMEKKEDGDEASSNRRFKYREGELQNWASLPHATIVVFHSWETGLLRVKSLDEEQRIVEFTSNTVWPFSHWQQDQRYYIENLREGLELPGEWYYNPDEARIYYLPADGESALPADWDARIPATERLLVLQGRPESGEFVEHVQFKNLRFAHSHFELGDDGHNDPQAAVSVSACIEATGARHCVWTGCAIQQTSNYAIWLRRGSQHNLVQRCDIANLGAGGVRIGEKASPPSEDEATGHNTIDNNIIHDGGRIFRAAVGVWIGRASHNEVTHNDIGKFRYTGVSVGWLWGYEPSTAHHNLIEYNHIHQIGMGQLNDMGGIYTLGVSPGTVLRGNVIHDVRSHPRLYGGWGLYTDEGSSEILLEKNIVYNTETGGFHQHYGRDNRVVNNIFAWSHGPQIVRTREEPHHSFFFERNIVFYNNGNLLGSNWKQPNFVLDGNIYWNTSGNVTFNRAAFPDWQALGHDIHSVIANPRFADPEAGDFSLAPDSPVRKLGFEPLDCTLAGLFGDDGWTSQAQVCLAPVTPLPQPPAPEPQVENFEATALGAVATNAMTLGEDGGASIRITDEAAGTGFHSLKFLDAPGLSRAFNPHLVYRPGLSTGEAAVTFALRVEPGAVVFHEWRDNASSYNAGPSITVDAEGNITASGQPIGSLPHSVWVRVSVTCGLGDNATGTYSVVIQPPGEEPQVRAGIPIVSPAFRTLDWLGFVSNATERTIFYLDDLIYAVS